MCHVKATCIAMCLNSYFGDTLLDHNLSLANLKLMKLISDIKAFFFLEKKN